MGRKEALGELFIDIGVVRGRGKGFWGLRRVFKIIFGVRGLRFRLCFRLVFIIVDG